MTKVDKNEPAMPVPAYGYADGNGCQVIYHPMNGIPLRLWIATHLWAGALADPNCPLPASWALWAADALIDEHNKTCESKEEQA